MTISAICHANELADAEDGRSYAAPPKKDEFVIKETAASKYECKCFVWSKKGTYRLVHSQTNSEGNTSNFVQDIQNGAVIASGRWKSATGKMDLSDAAFLNQKNECFNPVAVVKILKEEKDRILVIGHDSIGQDSSVWVKKEDLEKVNADDPKFKDRKRPTPIEYNQCMS